MQLAAGIPTLNIMEPPKISAEYANIKNNKHATNQLAESYYLKTKLFFFL